MSGLLIYAGIAFLATFGGVAVLLWGAVLWPRKGDPPELCPVCGGRADRVQVIAWVVAEQGGVTERPETNIYCRECGWEVQA